MALPLINNREQIMAMRKKNDEVFPNAAGIDVGASSLGGGAPRVHLGGDMMNGGSMEAAMVGGERAAERLLAVR